MNFTYYCVIISIIISIFQLFSDIGNTRIIITIHYDFDKKCVIQDTLSNRSYVDVRLM